MYKHICPPECNITRCSDQLPKGSYSRVPATKPHSWKRRGNRTQSHSLFVAHNNAQLAPLSTLLLFFSQLQLQLNFNFNVSAIDLDTTELLFQFEVIDGFSRTVSAYHTKTIMVNTTANYTVRIE